MTQDAYRSTAGWSEGSAAPLVEEVELAPRQRYRFEDRLAVGGMGEVLVCWDEVLQREVALK